MTETQTPPSNTSPVSSSNRNAKLPRSVAETRLGAGRFRPRPGACGPRSALGLPSLRPSPLIATPAEAVANASTSTSPSGLSRYHTCSRSVASSMRGRDTPAASSARNTGGHARGVGAMGNRASLAAYAPHSPLVPKRFHDRCEIEAQIPTNTNTRELPSFDTLVHPTLGDVQLSRQLLDFQQGPTFTHLHGPTSFLLTVDVFQQTITVAHQAQSRGDSLQTFVGGERLAENRRDGTCQ
jgi:hypothetical protein